MRRDHEAAKATKVAPTFTWYVTRNSNCSPPIVNKSIKFVPTLKLTSASANHHQSAAPVAQRQLRRAKEKLEQEVENKDFFIGNNLVDNFEPAVKRARRSSTKPTPPPSVESNTMATIYQCPHDWCTYFIGEFQRMPHFKLTPFVDTTASKQPESIKRRLDNHIVSCRRNKKLGKRIVHGKNPRAYVPIASPWTTTFARRRFWTRRKLTLTLQLTALSSLLSRELFSHLLLQY